MIISAITIELILPEARSLKEKRGPLKSLINAIRKNFNCSCVEADLHDLHQRAQLLVALAGRDRAQLAPIEQSLQKQLENNSDFILARVGSEYFSV